MKLKLISYLWIYAEHPRTGKRLCASGMPWEPQLACTGEYSRNQVQFVKDAANITMRRTPGTRKPVIKVKFL